MRHLNPFNKLFMAISGFYMAHKMCTNHVQIDQMILQIKANTSNSHYFLFIHVYLITISSCRQVLTPLSNNIYRHVSNISRTLVGN